MKKLIEGMRAGDLEDLVLPLISVDEYESKIDDDAVVIGFYVSDHDAARDLNRFVQKSPVMLLDTDISPAPDQHGYYLVFVELLNNERLAENISAILDEVTPLSRIETWQMRLRGVDRLVAFSQQAFASHFKELTKSELSGEDKEAAEMAESVVAFLQPSDIERVDVRHGELVLEGFGYRDEFGIVAFGPLDKILAEQELVIGTQDVGIDAAIIGSRMDRKLGEGWSVTRVKGMNLLLRGDSEEGLLLIDLK